MVVVAPALHGTEFDLVFLRRSKTRLGSYSHVSVVTAVGVI